MTTRQARPVVLLRPVPGTSPIHELWAGTKLIVVLAFSALLAFYPDWVPLALVTILIGIAIRMARIPRGVVPSVPIWLWLLLLVGCVTATVGGGEPFVHLGSVEIALGGLMKFVRVTVVAVVLLALGMLVSWTTNVADVAPAVAKLGRPFKALRFPVDDWAVALALSLRAFPMLLEEFRLLYAARRLRPRPVLTSRRARRRRWAIEMVDLMAAGITVALRRADEMGDAITARGGTGLISAAPSGPRRADWVVMTISFVVIAVSVVLQATVLAGI
ncbi:energy-coupling factor transport system permease protein [Mycolicibacterium sp. BK556]|uniref:energy-coupling factor transporter transmembrane component T family protein n=1 Tax=unclassified Mycolicibacterium TaxID=2636767 RepID=UPI00160F2C19|nr:MULTISPECIES: energy-coupling factor transporter transmembrane protein EcfT [unclassified Mycolicibacterium]MBB3603273.1 energy-coupling factor transport system permease protein [Mycolicibacterium sp. BK556]MBB3633468.1 energy-coupling factor transport system permease protein [Mycolicibacterium sp. BK607]